MLSCLDLLSCLELALRSLGPKLPYIADPNPTPNTTPNPKFTTNHTPNLNSTPSSDVWQLGA